MFEAGDLDAATATTLNGAAGNDTLIGSDFGETLCGGLGNDLLTGAGGTDRLVETGNVNIILTPVRLTGLGTDTLATIETASLTGGTSANRLDASAFAGAVLLNGGDVNDTLIGGFGIDSLDGEAGTDRATSGQGGSTRGGTGSADVGDFTPLAETIDELFATVFAFESS